MAVLRDSVKLAFLGSIGTIDNQNVQYEATYNLDTDDPLDQSAVIFNYFYFNGPWLGSLYSYGNDGDPTAYLTKISPTRRSGKSATAWQVKFTYSSDNNTEQKDHKPHLDREGQPTDDPLEMRPTISVTTAAYSKPVHKARYRKGLRGNAALATPAGAIMPPSNSVGVPFEPQDERDQSRVVVSVTQNFATVDGDTLQTLCDNVNSAAFQINYLGFTMSVKLYAAKITGNSVQAMRETQDVDGHRNIIDYLEQTKEMTIDPHGWRVEYVDRGIHARAAPGDPDGRGGFLSFSDMINGVPQIRRLLDLDGRPITEHVLLNGDGQPLANPLGNPVYLQYSKYDEFDFRLDDFWDEIIS